MFIFIDVLCCNNCCTMTMRVALNDSVSAFVFKSHIFWYKFCIKFISDRNKSLLYLWCVVVVVFVVVKCSFKSVWKTQRVNVWLTNICTVIHSRTTEPNYRCSTSAESYWTVNKKKLFFIKSLDLVYCFILTVLGVVLLLHTKQFRWS